MSLNIWQVDPANLTPYYNLALCKALAEIGNQVYYFTSRYLYDPKLPISSEYSIDYLYFQGLNQTWLLRHSYLRKALRGLLYPFGHQRLFAKIRANPPDIIHIQWSRLPRFDQHLISRIRTFGIPVVHTVHNVKSSFASTADLNRLGRVYTLASRLILHTEKNRQDFLATYPNIPIEKTVVIPMINASHAKQPNTNEDSILRLKKHLEIEPDHFVLLFFGIIRQYKGLKLLLEAFEKAYQNNQSLHLIIAGKAESELDLQEISYARAMKGVTVDERFIPYEELASYLGIADVVVFPYREITQSAALVQAMSFGKPIIVTNVGGLPSLVDENGWIIPKDDVNALVEAILEAKRNSIQLKKMGERSRSIIEANHEPLTIARQHLLLYQSLL